MMFDLPIAKRPLQVRSEPQRTQYFRHRISKWFQTNRRDFAWRRTSDPYRLLMAEMMLRRTRAAQVGPVYEAFIRRFPDPKALRRATEAEVARVLRPLGLTWRIPAFKLVADQLVTHFAGMVPQSRKDLMSLAGVGDYVADAVRCFAYGEAVAIVDTNTVRVASRYLGFAVGPDSRRKRSVIEAVGELLDADDPVNSNLALLDFAATICSARRPACTICPVRRHCSSFLLTGSRNRDRQLS